MRKQNEVLNIVVLSPHLDDAVLSLGSHILRWKETGKRIKVITIFTEFGDGRHIPDYSQDYLDKSGFNSVKEFEKARGFEDKEAMKKLGVEYEHWGFVDAGFRGFYKNREMLLSGELGKKDEIIFNKIENKINDIKADLFLVPYGVGGHADHVMVREAAEKIKNKNYYLESPYLWQDLNFVKYLGKIFRAKSVLIGKAEKNEILKCYQSQYGLLIKGKRIFTEIVI